MVLCVFFWIVLRGVAKLRRERNTHAHTHTNEFVADGTNQLLTATFLCYLESLSHVSVSVCMSGGFWFAYRFG